MTEKSTPDEPEKPPQLTLPNGNTIRILSPGADTDGRLTVIDYVDYTQGNPPPFTRHDFIEVFSVLDGRLAFQYQDEEVFLVHAGETETVASGRPHTFWNPDNTPLHILLSCSPAGLDAFFTDIHAEMEALRAGKFQECEFAERTARMRSKHGIEETAPPPVIG